MCRVKGWLINAIIQDIMCFRELRKANIGWPWQHCSPQSHQRFTTNLASAVNLHRCYFLASPLFGRNYTPAWITLTPQNGSFVIVRRSLNYAYIPRINVNTSKQAYINIFYIYLLKCIRLQIFKYVASIVNPYKRYNIWKMVIEL